MYNLNVIRNYARAIFEIALNNHVENIILEKLVALNDLINNSKEMKYSLSSPLVNYEKKRLIIKKLSKLIDLDQTIVRFFLLLVKNARISLLDDIIIEYKNLLETKNNIQKVFVISSKKLSIDEENEVNAEISKKFTDKKLQIDFTIDQSIIAGIIIKYGNFIFDCSIKTAMQNINRKVAFGY